MLSSSLAHPVKTAAVSARQQTDLAGKALWTKVT